MKNTYTKVHAVFALIALILGNIYVRCIIGGKFWDDGNASLSVFLFAAAVCAFGCIFFYLRKKKTGKETIFFMALTLIYSLRFAVYDKRNEIDIIAFLVIHAAVLLFFASFGAERSVLDSIVVAAAKAVAMPFCSLTALPFSFKAFFKRRTDEERRDSNIMFIAAGVCISLPVLGVVIALLTADAFFNNFAGEILDSISHVNIGEYINLPMVLVALYIYGALYSADKDKKEQKKINTRAISPVMSSTVMLMLTGVYAVFFAAQIDGYICMFTGRIPEYTTYAEFARSGFFNLCVVACINGAVMYFANAFAKYNSKGLKRFSAFLAILTLLIIATAAAKMVMYISEYGFTQKRFYTMWFMVLLAVLFILALVKLKNESFNLSRCGVYITAGMLVLLFFTDFEHISDALNNILRFSA